MAHALLSPSKFDRIIACPASLGQSMFQPNKASEYAIEGTVAHHVLEWNLNTIRKGSNDYIRQGHKVKYPTPDGDKDYFVTEEMLEAVNEAIDIVIGIALKGLPYYTEQKVQISSVHPECYGTADVVIVDQIERRFHVIDYKHGQGELIKSDSSQLILYALGVIETFDLYDFDTAVLHVIQPRHRNWSHEPVEIPVEDLLKLAEDFKKTAKTAYKQRNNPEDFNPGVSQCKWCPGATNCAAFNRRVLEVLDEEVLQSMNLEEKLDRIPLLKEWIKVTENHALEVAQSQTIPGYKLVNARTIKRWKGTDVEVYEELRSRLPSSVVEKLTQYKLLSPPQVRKLLDEEQYETLVADLVDQPLGKLTLAPTADPRREAIDQDFADPTI